MTEKPKNLDIQVGSMVLVRSQEVKDMNTKYFENRVNSRYSRLKVITETCLLLQTSQQKTKNKKQKRETPEMKIKRGKIPEMKIKWEEIPEMKIKWEEIPEIKMKWGETPEIKMNWGETPEIKMNWGETPELKTKVAGEPLGAIWFH